MPVTLTSPFDIGVLANVLQFVGAAGYRVDWAAVYSLSDYQCVVATPATPAIPATARAGKLTKSE
jgi:hypothetical protein